MNEERGKVVVGKMQMHERREWQGPTKGSAKRKNRLFFPKKTAVLTAALCVLALGAVTVGRNQTQAVMSHLTAGFEYDETLGRLQFVSNILPESAMVFLTTSDEQTEFYSPVSADTSHGWTQEEPWIEYAGAKSVSACSAGEVMTVVRNRQNEYTVRVMHDNGYESVYSGLTAVSVGESDLVSAGQLIGTAAGFTAFELRCDGLSVLPVFNEI